MLRKPTFWFAFVLVSVAASIFAARYFALGFPLVALEISMDRQAALAAARDLAARHQLGPADARQAASFSADSDAQTFIELEAGGKDALRRILEEDLYAIYTWRVRHFQEGETREVLFYFTPGGRPYGFRETLREDAPGASLSGDEARRLAERQASEAWGIAFAPFELVEQGQETRLAGRVDHTFVYERPELPLDDGRFRLRLVVSGDRLTEARHFVRVPQAFTRRFQEMRSANTAITAGSWIATVLLYLGCGAGAGLFLLLRGRWVLWRQAVLWGVIVALLQVLAAVNQWPLLWMRYDTALSIERYVLQQVVNLMAMFLVNAALFSVSFMAAESLTRRAFPHHPQFWRIWSRKTASSRPVLGFTVAGYLLVGVFTAYEVALYFVTSRYLGWWTPSDTLLHPDVLAAYFPWMTAIAASFQAGFWEEALFRAVPLAGAALVGERLGHRRAWLVAGFAVQAVIFGAGHAAYATQPSYARLVELIIPSIFFGLLYIQFGLLPGIVLHFAFDVLWFAMPLFASDAPGVWIDQMMTVLLVLVPLWVVLWQRWRMGRWTELAPGDRNEGWTPPVSPQPAVPEAVPRPVADPRGLAALMVAGAAGLVVWAGATPFGTDIPTFTTTRQEADAVARRVLQERGVTLDETWRMLATARDGRGQAHRFILDTAGLDRFFLLLGRHLDPPHWLVRVVTFEGEVAQRAEEWAVVVTTGGSVDRVRHELPEARSGASLDLLEARQAAQEAIRTRLGADLADLRDVSAVPTKRPARGDWTFTFTDRTVPALPEGEPRLRVAIAGREVVEVRRFVFVPEEWEREQRNEQTARVVLEAASALLFGGLLLGGGVAAIVGWSRRRFSVPLFVVTLATFAGTGVLVAANGWPVIVAEFTTAEPFALQALLAIGFRVVFILLSAMFAALIVGAAGRWTRMRGALPRATSVGAGIALGALAAGMAAAAGTVGQPRPVWPLVEPAASLVPVAATALAPVGAFFVSTAVLLTLFAGIDRYTVGWTGRRASAAVGLFVAGVLLGGLESSSPALEVWLAAALPLGLLFVAAYVLAIRFDLSAVPVGLGMVIVLDLVRSAIVRAYPGAFAGSLMAIAIVAGLVAAWSAWIRREREIS